MNTWNQPNDTKYSTNESIKGENYNKTTPEGHIQAYYEADDNSTINNQSSSSSNINLEENFPKVVVQIEKSLEVLKEFYRDIHRKRENKKKCHSSISTTNLLGYNIHKSDD